MILFVLEVIWRNGQESQKPRELRRVLVGYYLAKANRWDAHDH